MFQPFWHWFYFWHIGDLPDPELALVGMRLRKAWITLTEKEKGDTVTNTMLGLVMVAQICFFVHVFFF